MILRPATLTDADRLLAWRNDPVAVAYSTSKRAVTAAEHARWLAQALGPEGREAIWILEEPDGVPIGSVRLGHYVRGVAGGERFETEPCGHVSIVLDPLVRGRGWARTALEELAEEAERQGVRLLSATVSKDNTASLVSFLKAGFRPYTCDAEQVLLLRRLGPAGALRGAAGVESSPLSPTVGDAERRAA